MVRYVLIFWGFCAVVFGFVKEIRLVNFCGVILYGCTLSWLKALLSKSINRNKKLITNKAPTLNSYLRS